MAEYDTANEEDVNPKMDFRLEFNQEDPELWFATLECNMQTRGIKSQLSKKAVLVANLPAKVQTVCRPCLTNPSRDTPYKELKTRILKHYGPKEIEILATAESLRLESKPSELARKLLKTLKCCPNQPDCKLQNTMAKAYWLRQLPGMVAALFADAELKVDNKDALDKLLQRADDSYAQFTQTAESRNVARQQTVAEVTKESPRPQHPAETTKTGQERSRWQVQETSERYVLHTRQVRDSGSEVRPTRKMPPPQPDCTQVGKIPMTVRQARSTQQ